MSQRRVVFVDGTRTPFGRMGGMLKNIYASKLAGIGLKGLLQKTKIDEKAKVDCVFLGSAYHCSHSLNPARWAALYAGLSYETSASYIEMQCGSSIDAINHAAWKIIANDCEIIIAGGMESYSQSPAKFSMSNTPFKMIPPSPIEQTLSPINDDCVAMWETAENLKEIYNISREESDIFAYHSQMKAKKAWEKGLFKDEITPVPIPNDKGDSTNMFDKDEHIRPNTTIEGLSKLKPAFIEDGAITAGNASGRNDGAAFVLMMLEEKALKLGYTPLARWVSSADIGVDPKIMGIAPAYAIQNAIKKAKLKMGDIDIFECNEAFAVQNLSVIKELEKNNNQKISLDKWNPLGGAIAYGHPNGASGARICMFAIRELIRRNGRYGIFSTCCGGGLGTATVIENLKNS